MARSTTRRRGTRASASIGAALLVVALTVGGCGGTSDAGRKLEPPRAKPTLSWDPDMIAMKVEEYVDTYHGETPVRGTVLGVRQGAVVLDVGLEFALEVHLARVWALDCGPTALTGTNFGNYDDAVAEALPRGSEVVAALSAAKDNEDGAYIHLLSADGAGPAGPSVNEVVVRRGEAEPERAPILSLPQFGLQTEAQANRKLQSWQPPKNLPAVPDGIYWPKLKEAWIAAWRTSAGHVAGCVREAAKERKAYAEYQSELDEYQPGGKFYVPDWDLDHYDGFGDDHCDTCYWLRRLL